MKEKLINNWWFWVCLIPIIITVLLFIVAMTYALHPTEIRLYANDQMVATTQGVMKTQYDKNFNDCLQLCDIPDCFWSCENHYDSNGTVGCSAQLGYSERSFDKCFERLGLTIEALNNK